MAPIYSLLLLASAATTGSDIAPDTRSAEFEMADRAYAKSDWAAARQYFEIACTDNVANACTNLGVMNALGQGKPVDNAKAATYYQKSCVLNSGVGCANIGWFVQFGIGVDRDPLRAGQYYQQSCSLNFALGCRHLGNLHMTGEGVAQNTRLAIAYLSRALELDPNIDRVGVTYARSIAPSSDSAAQ